MSVTITQLYTDTPLAVPTSLLSGQIAVAQATESPLIFLTKERTVAPTFVSEEVPTILASRYQGLTWFQPSTSRLRVMDGKNYIGIFSDLIGCTTELSTCLGEWGYGTVTPDSVGPDYFTGLGNSNKPKAEWTGGVSRGVLISGRKASALPSSVQDYVYIGSGSPYQDNDGTVSIGQTEISGGDLPKGGITRVCGRFALSSKNFSSIPVKTVALGSFAGRDYVGTNITLTAVGLEAAYGYKYNSGIGSALVVQSGSGGNAPKRSFEDLFILNTNKGYFDSTTGTGVQESSLAIGVGCVATGKSLIIGRNIVPSSVNDTSITSISAGGTTLTYKLAKGMTAIGGNTYTATADTVAISCGDGTNPVMTLGRGSPIFKNNVDPGFGKVLVSGGPTAPPTWQTVPATFTVATDDRRIVTVENGMIMKVEDI
jgi:hypothetical protein